jgi:hypothetical protein
VDETAGKQALSLMALDWRWTITSWKQLFGFAWSEDLIILKPSLLSVKKPIQVERWNCHGKGMKVHGNFISRFLSKFSGFDRLDFSDEIDSDALCHIA